jgi:hypothetical protein
LTFGPWQGLLLLGGPTSRRVAFNPDNERTVYRLAELDFRRRMQALRADIAQRIAGLLTAAAVEAVKTLLELQKASAPNAVRLKTARAVLEIGTKLREAADLKERLAALEEQLAGTSV